MPKRSRNISHLLMIVGGAFALLLFAASVFAPRLKPFPSPSPRVPETSSPSEPSGRIEGASTKENAPTSALIDTSNWKTYRDPIYRFEVKYPSEWPNPSAKKISDPDFDYEYQATFGTAETIDGNGFEGFNIFVFPTEKCVTIDSNVLDSAGASSGPPSCASRKTVVQTDDGPKEKILEFSSKVFTYTLVPFIPENGADPETVKKTESEFSEAGKTFSFDSSLQPLSASVKKATNPKAPPKTAPPAARPSGRSGKITGAKSSGGRLVCPHPNRKPQRSPNKGNHVDEDCCPDPDEYPNAACAYKPSDYKIML